MRLFSFRMSSVSPRIRRPWDPGRRRRRRGLAELLLHLAQSRLGAAGDGDLARAHDLLDAEGPQQLDDGLDLATPPPSPRACRSSGVTSTTLARKMSPIRRISARCRGLGVHPDEQHLALHVVLVGEVGHLDDVDQLVELLDHLLDDEGVAADHQGHPRHAAGRASRPPTGSRCCSRAPRTARPRARARRTCSRPAPRSCASRPSSLLSFPADPSPPRPRPRRDPGRARDLGYQNPVCDFAACSRTSRLGGARIMSVLAPPAGTIGNTHSSLSTHDVEHDRRRAC